MAQPLLNFKIILCNVLNKESLGSVSNETEFCATIEDTRRSIENFQAPGDARILLGCKQEDLTQLLDIIFNDRIHAVFVLNNNSVSVIYNKQLRTGSVEKDFLIDFLFEAAQLVRDEANGKKRQEVRGFNNARWDIFNKLLDLIKRAIFESR